MNEKIVGKSLITSNRVSDLLGIYALCMLLILIPLHFAIYHVTVYYREVFAVFFSILLCFKFYNHRHELMSDSYKLKKELFFLISFPILLLLFAFVDPGRNLYGSNMAGASLHLLTVNPDLYVLRNALLYLPMVIYFAFRGFTEAEIRRIAFLIVVLAPICVLAYLYHYRIATISTLNVLAKLGGGPLSYNTYVPYLTFPVISALYLIVSDTKTVVKLISFTSLVLLSIYIILSTSRQCTVFIAFSCLIFILHSRELSLFKKLIFLSLYLLCVYTGEHLITTKVVINTPKELTLYNRLNEKYTVAETINTPRLQIAKDGLAILKPTEFLVGAGLSSVINAGPHNDYIRWIQRIGIFGMIVGFCPFFLAAFRAYYSTYFFKKNSLMLYLFFVAFFTLYHSLFSYPREDAYQAMYCFLGLSMWLGIGNSIVTAPEVTMQRRRLWPDFSAGGRQTV